MTLLVGLLACVACATFVPHRPMRAPALFVPHGGGPLPLLNRDEPLSKFLASVLKGVPQTPRAIVLVSAHWEAQGPKIIDSAKPPGLLYDYHGFPPETYQYSYHGRGDPDGVGKRLVELLQAAGFSPTREETRGFDHGVFVPMMLIDPEATIPVIELSLLPGLDPARHIEMGRAISPLLDENVIILGSGMSFHRMESFFRPAAGDVGASEQFHEWLKRTCIDVSLSAAERLEHLTNWADAPKGRFCHPREEHLIPLHVVAGAAQGRAGKCIYEGTQRGLKVLGVEF